MDGGRFWQIISQLVCSMLLANFILVILQGGGDWLEQRDQIVEEQAGFRE